MSADHERFAEWDAAYVLGSLSPADRRAFEAHLEGCDLCRTAIAELAPVTGLLSRVDADHASTMLSADAAAVDAAAGRDALLRRAQADSRRRRRLRWGVFALAAALLVVAAIAVPAAISSQTPKLETVAFEKLVDAPITASVELDPVEWGTRIDLDCAYGTDGEVEPPADGWPYALVITGQDGTESEVSSWRSWPDSHAWVTAGTALGRDQIKSMEIRSLTTGAVLMRADVDDR
nr:zf-HC2 domain-containing protein [Microbacterium lemovicicum]